MDYRAVKKFESKDHGSFDVDDAIPKALTDAEIAKWRAHGLIEPAPKAPAKKPAKTENGAD